MKVYEVCVKPASDFATPLQGDSLFGQICCQIAQDSELTGEISELLSDYAQNPFCVVSDPIMRFELKDKPVEYVMPKAFCFANRNKQVIAGDRESECKEYDARKKNKKAAWVVVSKQQPLSGSAMNNFNDLGAIKERYNLDKEWQPVKTYRQTHNSIDRYTGTTGSGGQFAPFSLGCISYDSNLTMSIFIGLRDDVVKSGIETALRRIGAFGYGADATTGKGRFNIVGDMREINLSELGDANGNAFYTLSAVVPEKNKYKKIFFEPFVRFGRHGGSRANSEFPFKQPVLKAAAGAVLVLNSPERGTNIYAGSAVKNLSKFSDTVEQGYSLVIPMKVEAVS